VAGLLWVLARAGYRDSTSQQGPAINRLVDNELFSDLTDSERNYWTSTPFKALDGSAAKLYYMGDFAFDGGTRNNEYVGHADDDRFYGCLILVNSR
jgi:hypothetical protein